jgi:hypothetical protein
MLAGVLRQPGQKVVPVIGPQLFVPVGLYVRVGEDSNIGSQAEHAFHHGGIGVEVDDLATDQLKLAFDLGSFRCPKTGQLIEDSPREGFFANSAAIF